MQPAATAHFVLTRFNVPLSFAKQNYGLDDHWLEHRFALFENFCLPSVAAQTKRDFHWMLLIDDKTPERWRTRLENDVKNLTQAHIIPTDHCSEAFFVREIHRYTAPNPPPCIISTRLDNDDAIARDYLEEISKCANSVAGRDRHYVVNFRRGCQLSKTGVFGVSFRLNAFLSLVSPYANLKTVACQEHGKMDEIAKVIDNRGFLDRRPYWLQVIHNVNLANDLNRRRKSINESALERFALGNDWRNTL